MAKKDEFDLIDLFEENKSKAQSLIAEIDEIDANIEKWYMNYMG